MSLEEYRRFIASRNIAHQEQGIEPKEINGKAKAHQVAAIEFALSRL